MKAAEEKLLVQIETRVEPEHGKDDEHNPTKGVFWYVLHTLLLSANLYSGKYLFALNPTLTVTQLAFARSALSSLICLLWVNLNLKATMVDAVTRDSVGSLVFRCLQGGLSVTIGFLCIKYFSVSTVGIVCSLVPIFVCLLAWLFLGERMTWKDCVALAVVIIAASLVILGNQEDTSQKE